MKKGKFSLQTLFVRGLLITAVLFLYFTSSVEAITLKVIVQPKQYKEFLILVNGIGKMTTNQEAIFEVKEGKSEIIIGNKKIVKEINRNSKVQIYYTE